MDQSVRAATALIEDHHWWFVGRRALLAALLREFAASGPLLDAGCGSGGNLAILGAFGDVVAFEPEPSARALARLRGVGEVIDGRLPRDIPRVRGGFGTVLMADVLEHLDEHLAALRTVRLATAPGGRLLLTVPADPALWALHDVRHGHKRRYTDEMLRSDLEATGWLVERVGAFHRLAGLLATGLHRFGIPWRSSDTMVDLALRLPFGNGALSRISVRDCRAAATGTQRRGLSLFAVAMNPPTGS